MSFQDFLEILDLIKDPAKYEAKLNELISHEEAIKANIALSDDVSDINTAKQAATDTLNAALKTLEDAKKEAEQIKQGQRAAYDKKLADLAALQVEASQAIADKKAMDSRIASINADIAVRTKELTARETDLLSRLAEANALKEDLNARLEKLRSVMG